MQKIQLLAVDLKHLIDKWQGKKGNLIMVLHEIQNQFGYVPRGVCFQISTALDIPLAQIYEVITFYNYFKTEPPGKHRIQVCMGTACYLKGAPVVVNEIKSLLKIEEGQTSPDGVFQFDLVRCLGCCGLAPVMMVDDKVYGKVKRKEIRGILDSYKKQDK